MPLNDPHVYDHTSPAGNTNPDWHRTWGGSKSQARDSLRVILAAIGIPVGILSSVGDGIPMLFVGGLAGAVIGFLTGWAITAGFRLVFVKLPQAVMAALKGPREPTL